MRGRGRSLGAFMRRRGQALHRDGECRRHRARLAHCRLPEWASRARRGRSGSIRGCRSRHAREAPRSVATNCPEIPGRHVQRVRQGCHAAGRRQRRRRAHVPRVRARQLRSRRARPGPARAPPERLRCRTAALDAAYNFWMETAALRARIEEHIRRHDLIPAGAEVTCLVSGGPDSKCLWHALGALGYRVSALHVNHKLRGEESEEDARFCREVLGAEVIEAPPTQGGTEAELRELRYSIATDRLRATGHTASDQVETILYRLATSGRPGGIKPRREDGVVRPLLPVWREETEAYCDAVGLPFRSDSSNPDTKRGMIRNEILPLLRRLHPAADENLYRLAESRRMPPPLAEFLDSE